MADYWKIILEEIRYYHDNGYHCRYSNLQETDIFTEKMEDTLVEKPVSIPKITYSLPSPYDHLYLTEREAECIYCLQHNLTIKSTGILLNLSARTVEFYLKNIKNKMKLRTKSEVLHHLRALDFNTHEEIHDALQCLIQSSSISIYIQTSGGVPQKIPL